MKVAVVDPLEEEDGQEDSTQILIEMPMTLLQRLGIMEQMKILTLAREVAEDLVQLHCLIISSFQTVQVLRVKKMLCIAMKNFPWMRMI